jgi:hypothetical protein
MRHDWKARVGIREPAARIGSTGQRAGGGLLLSFGQFGARVSRKIGSSRLSEAA